jgi:hypothetical protein
LKEHAPNAQIPKLKLAPDEVVQINVKQRGKVL